MFERGMTFEQVQEMIALYHYDVHDEEHEGNWACLDVLQDETACGVSVEFEDGIVTEITPFTLWF